MDALTTRHHNDQISVQSNNMSVSHLKFIWHHASIGLQRLDVFCMSDSYFISILSYLYWQRIQNVYKIHHLSSHHRLHIYQTRYFMVGRVASGSRCLQPVCPSWPLTLTRHFHPRVCWIFSLLLGTSMCSRLWDAQTSWPKTIVTFLFLPSIFSRLSHFLFFYFTDITR